MVISGHVGLEHIHSPLLKRYYPYYPPGDTDKLIKNFLLLPTEVMAFYHVLVRTPFGEIV